jgi:hypothetical protein
MYMETFLEFVKQNGLAAGCLIVLAVAVWRSLVWFARELAKPLFDRLMRFVDTAESLLRQQSQDITAIHQKVDRIEHKQDEHFQVCSRAVPVAPRRA